MAMDIFDEWALTVDALCHEHLVCSWGDLCGDVNPLRRGFEAGETPRGFVRWWAVKYDLIRVEPKSGGRLDRLWRRRRNRRPACAG